MRHINLFRHYHPTLLPSNGNISALLSVPSKLCDHGLKRGMSPSFSPTNTPTPTCRLCLGSVSIVPRTPGSRVWGLNVDHIVEELDNSKVQELRVQKASMCHILSIIHKGTQYHEGEAKSKICKWNSFKTCSFTLRHGWKHWGKRQDISDHLSEDKGSMWAWFHLGGEDNETHGKHVTVITGGNVNQDAGRNRSFKIKQETLRKKHE